MKRARRPDALPPVDLSGLPGAELVLEGLDDLRHARVSECALLVLVASPRLSWLGLEVPELPGTARPYEHELYALLEAEHGDAAYSRYNADLRRMTSFCQALERFSRGA